MGVRCLLTLILCAGGAIGSAYCRAETILFESGTLGETGISRGDVAAANVSPAVFNGVRFELTKPIVTSQIGGHFVGSENTTDTFFGAIVKLEDENDFPDSGDLSTPDVLGNVLFTFPDPSAEVLADLELELSPGWYTLVFGSGLFGAFGDGAMPLNNPDIGTPSYLGFQPGAGWLNITEISTIFVDYRFVVLGTVVPEPASSALWLNASLLFLFIRQISTRAA